MKVLGVVLLISALVIASAAVKRFTDQGFGSTAGEQTRTVVGPGIPAVLLVFGILLIVRKKK